jgi:hypothetical protein
MLAAGREDPRRTTSTDCHAAARVSIVPRGDTAVAMPTATACSHTDFPTTATTTRTCSAPASTATPAMGECGRYRQPLCASTVKNSCTIASITFRTTSTGSVTVTSFSGLGGVTADFLSGFFPGFSFWLVR